MVTLLCRLSGATVREHRRQTTVHVELVVAVKQECPRVAGNDIDFGPAHHRPHHHDIFKHAARWDAVY
jgi:hypothetical protein